MAEGIKIEIFKLKNADELTKSLADPESRMETGGAAAMTAARKPRCSSVRTP